MTKAVKKNRKARRTAASLERRSKAVMTTMALSCASAVAAAQDAPTPYFTDMSETNFPQTKEAGLPCPDDTKPGCYTNWLVITDLEKDGDKDILFANGGDYYTPSALPTESTVFVNDGSGAFQNVWSSKFGSAVSHLRQVSVGDVDGDGDLDIYQPGGYGLDLDKLFIQGDDGSFTDKASSKLPGKLTSTAGSSHLGDLDNDGDLDIVVGDWGVPPLTGNNGVLPGNTWIYLNDGAGNFSQMPTNAVPPPMRSIQNIDPNTNKVDPNDHGWGRTPIDIDLHDIDGDFDLDIVVNHRNGQSRLYLNDGTAHFDDGTYSGDNGEIVNYPYKLGPYSYNQELCDVDYDGDLDLLLDNAGPKPEGVTRGDFTQLLINDGSGHFDDLTVGRVFEPTAIRADDNAVKCADFNGDGFYDLLVVSLTIPGEKILINDGTGKWTHVPGAIPTYLTDSKGNPADDATLGVDIADLNGDGLLDIVTGQGEGGASFEERVYFGSDNSKPDVTPPAFRKVEEVTAVAGEPTVIRFGVRDRVTSETGEQVKSATFSYNTGADSETLPASFVGGDLFRAVIPAFPVGTTIQVTLEITDYADLKATHDIELVIPGGEEPTPDAGSEPDASTSTPDAGMSGGDGDESPAGDGDMSPSGDGDGEPLPTSDGGVSCPTPDVTGPGKDTSSDDCSVTSPGLAGHGNLMAGLMAGLAMIFRTRTLRRRVRARK